MVTGSPIPAVIAVQLRKIISRFEQHDAFTPDRAVSPEEIGLSKNFIFRRLVTRGVLRETTTNRYCLDREKLADFNDLRRKKILIIMGIIIIVILIYALLYNHF